MKPMSGDFTGHYSRHLVVSLREASQQGSEAARDTVTYLPSPQDDADDFLPRGREFTTSRICAQVTGENKIDVSYLIYSDP